MRPRPGIKQRSSLTQWVIAGLLVMFVCSCASAPVQQPAYHGQSRHTPQAVIREPGPEAAPAIEQRLRTMVRSWIGTPHRMGGDGRKGVDCSGFVLRVYLDLFDVRLPRSTAQQVRAGTTIAKRALRTGDLVFFHPPNKIRHVGIYLGSGEFAHASTSKGVTISCLNTPYWRNAYWTAKRILPNQT